MKPFQVPVNSQYGAPMGRFDRITDLAPKLHLEHVPLIDGAYDQGGAYWGAPATLYCAWSEGANGLQAAYTRAPDHSTAKQSILARYPAARFYR